MVDMADSSRYCARLIEAGEVAGWQALRRQLALFDLESMRGALAACPLRLPARRPRLLFGESDVATIRLRADEAIRERIRRHCDRLISDPPDPVDDRLATSYSRPARFVAGGFLVLQDERYAEWVLRRIEALLTRPSWMFQVHASFVKRCDHVMANVAADLVCAHDLLGEAVSDPLTDRLAEGLRRLLLIPYLDGMRSRDEFWAGDACLHNWKIMTCGESGLVLCAMADRWPEAREGLTLSADGVLEILDAIPPEGDWPEGVVYWYATLFMGLRFGWALRRLTGGRVDLLTHPRLTVTGDFGSAHISPAGRVYNYGDNGPALGPYPAEALLLLASAQSRPDWRAAACQFPSDSPLWLYLDDPSAAKAPPSDGARVFVATGAGLLRRSRTFIGMRSGDSTVGHAHLDSNSFMVETRGVSLIRDSGLWPYAHPRDFFDYGKGYGGGRWNFDGLATIGHNAILVDGQGQAYGGEYAGQIAPPVTGDGWMRLDGDASKCYPGLLTKWRRSLLLVGEDLVVIRDVIQCEGERHLEWLLHSAAEFRDEGDDTVLTLDPVCARLVPLLPDRVPGWRVSDVTRRSIYRNTDFDQREHQAIRYRGFSLLKAVRSMEFLFLIHLDAAHREPIAFHRGDTNWRIDLPDSSRAIIPSSDSLMVAVLSLGNHRRVC